MRLLFYLALYIAAVAAEPKNPQRIVGGTTTTITQHPSIVALLFSRNMNSFRQVCGGTIINNRSILTAAHCPHGDSPGMWRIRAGSTFANSGGTIINVDRIIVHPSYISISHNHDIAILRLRSTIAFNNNARAAQVPGNNYALPDNSIVWAAGWGRISENGALSETLRHVQIRTINQATCRLRYFPTPITENMLCSGILDVGGRDQCQGDSGGPLYHNNNVVVGVCSFGRGCARPRHPGVNVRVTRYTSWIQQNA